MEQTGNRAGILFLDEINCVSETLMPAMQELINRLSGKHRRIPLTQISFRNLFPKFRRLRPNFINVLS